jgi:hypothetical protein
VSADTTEPVHLFFVALNIQAITFNEVKILIVGVDIIICVAIDFTLELNMVRITSQLGIFLNDCADYVSLRNVLPIRSVGSIAVMHCEPVGSFDDVFF